MKIKLLSFLKILRQKDINNLTIKYIYIGNELAFNLKFKKG